MRETRPSGSEGGGAGQPALPTPIEARGIQARVRGHPGRLLDRDRRLIRGHTPVHASWCNRVEISFSIIQRKVLTPTGSSCRFALK